MNRNEDLPMSRLIHWALRRQTHRWECWLCGNYGRSLSPLTAKRLRREHEDRHLAENGQPADWAGQDVPAPAELPTAYVTVDHAPAAAGATHSVTAVTATWHGKDAAMAADWFRRHRSAYDDARCLGPGHP